MNQRALEEATARFYDWELSGRGWRLYSHRVPLEPPFRPFTGHRSPPTVVIDDGRKPTRVSRFIERITRSTPSALAPTAIRPDEEPSPDQIHPSAEPHAEFEILLPAGTKIDPLVVPGLIS